MEDGRPSRTALMLALNRAHHALTAPEPKILNDTFAMQLAGLASPAEVNARFAEAVERLAAFGDRAAAEAFMEDADLRACARSRLVEDQLAEAMARGVKQMVILGAGLDSTAYRRTDLGDVPIFEVDFPATQVWKRGQLAKIGVAIPPNLAFVPFDFERQTLAQALAAGGVRDDCAAFFSWLGVQPYLTDDAVMATLEVMAGYPAGSELVMDLLTPREPVTNAVTEGRKKVLASMGEAFKSTYEPEVFKTRLAQRGFTDINIMTYRDWIQRHEARFHGRYAGSIGPMVLVTARVGAR